MAMRPTSRRGGTLPSSPRRAAVRPVYEDFRPVTERQQDEESNVLLLIYLPGFQKEHLKVSTEGRNILRARGERLVAGNKWSRFQEDYLVPEDCNIRGIRAKFEGRILTITIPRKREGQDAAKEAAKVTEETPKPSQRTQGDLSSQKQPSSPKAAVEKMHQKVADDKIGANAIPSVGVSEKGRDEKIRETLSDQKMLSEAQRKNADKRPEKSKEESDHQKSAPKIEKLADQAGDAIKKTIEESKAQKHKVGSAYEDFGPLKSKKPEKSEEVNDYQKSARRIKKVLPDQVPNIMRKATEKSEEESDYQKSARKIEKVPDQVENIMRKTTEKPKSQKDKGNIEPKEKKTTTAAAASSGTYYGLGNYEQPFKNFLDLNEGRQLLVNVGAAVLVIVAFGAYLFYTFQEKLHDI